MRAMLREQPAGLFYIFFAELWERFSYYGMRALFILYMGHAFLFSDKHSYAIYGAYGTLVYISPIIGGYLADRVLGYRRAVIMGGICMALGQFSLMVQQLSFFYAGLALLILGNGMLKPNLASLLGRLYAHDDPRRDAGFTLYYVGINLGSFFAPIACGFVGAAFGWHWGFGLAGLGMLLGLFVFVSGSQYYREAGDAPDEAALKQTVAPLISRELGLYLVLLACIPLIYYMIANLIAGWFLAITCFVVFGLIIMMALRSESIARKHIFALLILMAFAAIFWSFSEQAGSSLNLFAERNIDRHLFHYLIPTAMFQAINPMYIFIFGPIFSVMWLSLANKKINVPTGLIFGLGILQLAAGFYIFSMGAQIGETVGHVSMLWLFGGYLLTTTGELFIEPIGMSMVTKLAPRKYVGMMMGAWFLADGAISNYLAAKIAEMSSVSVNLAGDATVTAVAYHNLFFEIAIAAGIAGVIAVMFTPVLKRLMV